MQKPRATSAGPVGMGHKAVGTLGSRLADALTPLGSTLKVPIQLLAQLSRQTTRCGNHRPTVSDVPYAGGCDFGSIPLLWRLELCISEQLREQSDNITAEKCAEIEAAFWRWGEEVGGKTQVALAKARMGAVGSAWVRSGGLYTRFIDRRPNPDKQRDMIL